MDFIYMLFGLSTYIIFMFKIEILFNQRYFFIYLIYTIILYCVAVVLSDTDIANKTIVPALKIPLLSAVAFYILFKIFYALYQRNPVNTFGSYDKQNVKDVLFCIFFLFLGVILPIYIVSLTL